VSKKQVALHIIHLPQLPATALSLDRYVHIRYTGNRGNEYRTLSSDARSTPILLAVGESAFVSLGRKKSETSDVSYSVEERIVGGEQQSKTATHQWIERTVITVFDSEEEGTDALYASDSKQNPTLNGVADGDSADYFADSALPSSPPN